MGKEQIFTGDLFEKLIKFPGDFMYPLSLVKSHAYLQKSSNKKGSISG